MSYPALDPDYTEAASPPEVARPYVGLWAGVMLRALDDAQGRVLALHISGFKKKTAASDSARKRMCSDVVSDAVAWFESDDQAIGSFLWICELLGVDPGAVRERLGHAEAGVVRDRHGHCRRAAS